MKPKLIVATFLGAVLLCWPILATAGSARIYAARVGANGQVLDASGIEIAPFNSGVQENPRVAFFNGVFLVVWQDLRNGSDDDVLAARVSMTGQVLDSAPIAIAVGPRTQAMPDVDADDEGFMVVWHGYQDTEKYPHVFAARVGADGTVGEAAAIADGSSPRVAWNGTNHFVTYQSVYTAGMVAQTRSWLRMTKSRSVLSQAGYGFVWGGGEGPQRYAVCAMPGANKGWTIVTHEGVPNFWGGLGVQRAISVTTDGTIDPSSPTYSSGVSLESHPPNAGAANWLDVSFPYAPLWPWGGAAAAPDGQYCVAMWQRYHVGGSGAVSGISMGNGDIYVARVDKWDPVESSGVPVAASSANERNPALAGNGAGTMLAVYEKILSGRTALASRLISLSSSISVGNEVPVMPDNGPGGTRRANPAVAFGPAMSGNPGVFVVVWQEGWHGNTSLSFTPPLASTEPPPPSAPPTVPKGVRLL